MQNPSSDAGGSGRRMRRVRAGGRRGGRGRRRPGLGARVHLRLRLRAHDRPAAGVRHVRQETRGGGPRRVQCYRPCLWPGKSTTALICYSYIQK